MTKPPAMTTTMAASTAAVPAMRRNGLLENREKARILLLSFRRQGPLFAHRFFELAAEERLLHPAVDDLPRQHRVARPIAEHEEVGVDAGFGDRGTPVAAVPL